MTPTLIRATSPHINAALPVPLGRRTRSLFAHHPLLRFGWLLLFLFGPLTLGAAKPQWEPVSAAELAEDMPRVEPSAGVEILSYHLDIDDRPTNRREILRRIRFKIFDPSRAFEATRIATLVTNGYRANHDNDIEIAAQLTLPDGSVRKFGKTDLRSRSIFRDGRANGFLGYITGSNWEAEEKFLAISGVVKGSILDIWEWQRDSGKLLWHVLPIQRREIPIHRFEYTSRFKYDPQFMHRFYVLNPNGGKMSHDEKEGLITFQAENLASLPDETLAAPEAYYSLTIIQTGEEMETYLQQRHSLHVPLPKEIPAGLGPWVNLSTKADFYDADWGFVTKQVKQKAAELTAGATTEREKARRIYKYVQSLYQQFRTRADLENRYTRYIESVDELIKLDQIDSTIIRPIDFYYLFIGLTRAAGLESHSAFHPMRTSFRFVPDLVAANLISFRTVAVKVDGIWEICEPCSMLPLAFGQRPWVIENQPALLAMPQQQIFISIPPMPAEDSVCETIANLELDTAGNLQGECVRTFTGHEAEVTRERLNAKGRENWWKLMRSIFDLESSSAEPRLISVEGQDTPEEPLRIKVFIRWPAYADLIQGRMMLAPSILNAATPPLLSATTRKTPVFFLYPVIKRDAITIQLPQGYRPGSMPAPISSSSGDFSYAMSMKFDAVTGKLSVVRESINRAVEIPVENYSQAHDWFTRVSAADQITVFLRSGEPKK